MQLAENDIVMCVAENCGLIVRGMRYMLDAVPPRVFRRELKGYFLQRTVSLICQLSHPKATPLRICN